MTTMLTHLQRLEAEAIHIMREVVAEAERPVMLYSVGKDSAVMLHLAKKAFFPGPLPFPLLHVDTTWKFRDMYALRDKVAADPAVNLIVYKNPEAESRGINPFDHGPLHTDMWKTEGLKQALDHYGFDAAFGGARRDEEKSRAKERIFSFRDRNHRWDPKRQRPELAGVRADLPQQCVIVRLLGARHVNADARRQLTQQIEEGTGAATLRGVEAARGFLDSPFGPHAGRPRGLREHVRLPGHSQSGRASHGRRERCPRQRRRPRRRRSQRP